MRPEGYNIRVLRKLTRMLDILFPETQDTAVIDPTDIVLKLSQPVVSGKQ
jgi:hypothetical protein